jgi:hypothetical protein
VLDLTSSATGDASPVSAARSASNGCAMRVLPRMNNSESGGAYSALESVFSRNLVSDESSEPRKMALSAAPETESGAPSGRKLRPPVRGLFPGLVERRRRRGLAAFLRHARQAACAVPANTIVPSRFHVPPSPAGASHNGWTGPPEARIFFSLPLAKNAMKRPSGDQNGNSPSSVPASGLDPTPVKGRCPKKGHPSGSPRLEHD